MSDLEGRLLAAACREMGRRDPQAVANLAAVAAAVAQGTLDGGDLDAVLASDEPFAALAALASLPSVRVARTGARLRLRAQDAGLAGHAAGA